MVLNCKQVWQYLLVIERENIFRAAFVACCFSPVHGVVLCIFQVLCLITFICATANYAWTPYGGGWVQFVSMAAFIITIILFVFHLTNIILKLPGPWFMIVSTACTGLCCAAAVYKVQGKDATVKGG